MGALISGKFLRFSRLPFSPPLPPFYFRPFSPNTPLFLHFSHRKQSRSSKIPIFSSVSSPPSSNSLDFGGWDDLEAPQQRDRPRELDRLRSFLISIGVDDKRHVFLFLIGFISALTVSRVKFSSVAVLPASVSVFVAGFFIGFIRGTHVDGEGFKYAEKMRNFSNLLSELDSKLSELKNEMEGVIDSDSVEVGEIKRYCEIVESVRLKVSPARNLVEASVHNDWKPLSSNRIWGPSRQIGFLHNVSSSSSDKSSKRRKDLGEVSFNFVKFLIGGLFQENSIGSKPHKSKDGMKRGSIEENNQIGADLMNGSILASRTEKRSLNPVAGSNGENSEAGFFYQETSDNPNVCQNQQQDESRPDDNVETSSLSKNRSLQVGLDGSCLRYEKVKVSSEMVRRIAPETLLSTEKLLSNAKSILINGKQFKSSRQQQTYNDHMWSYNGELRQENDGLQISNKYGSSKVRDEVGHTADFDIGWREDEVDSLSMEVKASPQQEQARDGCNGAYFPSRGEKRGRFTVEKRTYGCDSKRGIKRAKSEEDPISDNSISTFDKEEGEMPLPPTISGDEEFNLYMKEAAELLKQARECLTGQLDEETAEIVLYKSATLLSRAITMKPRSLQAVGQLGNTFLLHGELKLKISRELRTLLSRINSLSDERRPRGQSPGSRNQVLSKDEVALALVDVCEECEQLLLEAGRRYRMALSIDGNDTRALYNWGLALSFRAQLIGDIGPEAAVDADKVYLAAIDKFDALMSRNNAYAPEALFRWGIALQQRSRLRSSNSKEKMKLLYQAKRLFEDALRLDGDNLQIREALSSCISEVNHRHL